MNHDDFLAQAAVAKTQIKQVSSDQVEAIATQLDVLILDVREADEYQSQHLPSAVNVSLDNLEQTIQTITQDKSTPVVCYCSGGNRGAIATHVLNQMGYDHAVSLDGGLRAWISNGKDTIDG